MNRCRYAHCHLNTIRSIANVTPTHLSDGLRDEFFQDLAVDIVELLDIEATFSRFVLSKTRHECLVLQAGTEVKNQIGFPWRKSGQASLTISATVVFVVILSKTDDRWSPHFRRFPRHFFHERDKLLRVLALLWVINP